MLEKIKSMSKTTRFFILIVSFTLLFILLYNTSLGRYVYNAINNYILESQNFYFNSSVLSDKNPMHSITNWDGVNPYPLTIDLNNKKNELVSTNTDISYVVSLECPSSVTCSLSQESGIIFKDKKVDSYTITVTPINSFYEGDQVVIKTSATSTYPYSKTISASYSIGVQNYGFSSKITDSVGSKYLTLELTNSKPYYEVVRAFRNYKVGDQISLNVYNTLTDAEKANCVSLELFISFNPNDILLDLTENAYINRIANTQTTTTLNGYTYVTGFGFYLGANEHEKIVFYKNDKNQDYSNVENIVSVQKKN